MQDKIYILYCIGSEVFFDGGKFKALCQCAFKEDPLKTDKYKEAIDNFLENCKDRTQLSCVEEGTEKLQSIELKLI